jgi:hypothetical protein
MVAINISPIHCIAAEQVVATADYTLAFFQPNVQSKQNHGTLTHAEFHFPSLFLLETISFVAIPLSMIFQTFNFCVGLIFSLLPTAA